MKKAVQKIPFLRLAAALIAGILIASFVNIPVTVSLVAAIFFLIFIALLNRFYKFRFSSLFGLGVSLFFIFSGITVYNLYNQKPDFYKSGTFLATVIEAPAEKANSYQSVLEIQSVKKNDSILNTNEKVLTYFEKTDAASTLLPGDVILFDQIPQQIRNNGNPYEFDYKKFLARKRIYRQVYLPEKNWNLTNIHASFSMRILAERTRLRLLTVYRNENLGENELNILSALTLGYKRELDPETKRVFSAAGAMHVLAVSGLHVGIIFFLLKFLLGFLRKQKAGIILFVLTVISVLWVFAFVTGLSPSVSRAATMFTFFVVGDNLRRQNNIYNSLAGSALFLLLVNPNSLFEVGFQLSYSAVFGIVFLQPKFEKLIKVEHKVPKYFWQLLTVSIAAQIATFPFSIFYFNQFPVYFWISNLVVIPVAFILIPSGFLLLALHSVPFLGNIISVITSSFAWFLFAFLKTVDNFPFSVREIVISPTELVFLFGLLISIFILITNRKKIYFKAALLFLMLLLTTSLVDKVIQLYQKQLIVYNDPDHTILHLISGKTNYVVSEKKLNQNDYSMRSVKNTITKLKLANPLFLTTNTIYQDELLVLENGLLIFDNKIVLIHPETELQTHEPDIIVNPGNENILTKNSVIVSNKKYYKKKVDENYPVFNLNKEGAFIKKW